FSFYGTSETSSIKTETKPESNLINWGKNGVDFKVVNGILHLKSNSVTLIGQLFKGLQKGNWIKTDDIVEEKEKGFYEVRGRENDQVIVAGKRVLLTDIKSVILTIKGVEACHVFSKPNSIIGNIIAAEVVANNHVTVPQIRKYCMNNLDDYKVPTEIKLIDNWWVNHRLKSDF
ncbi:MAG: AMP-binding enzyme, partial [Bacteroidia bacterium]